MPESANQASSHQRRANWVALRTLRQLPKPAGETADGEPIYEIRSVRLLLQGAGTNFVRLTECSRCGLEMAGAPVLTPADLDRSVRPMICTDCIRKAGVSTVWETEGAEAAAVPVEREREPAMAPARPAGPAAEDRPARLDVLERHLRAVTDRVNELGRLARAQQADSKERAGWEKAPAAELHDELATLRGSVDDTRSEVQRLAGAQAELERSRAIEAAAAAGPLGEEVARLAQLVEEQRAEIARLVSSLGETKRGHAELTFACQVLEGRLAEAIAEPVDLEKVEELVTTRLAEAGARLTDLIAGQRDELKADIEGSVRSLTAGLVRADEELASGQAVLQERIEDVAGQVAQALGRLGVLLDRLDEVEAAATWAPETPAGPASPAGTGGLLDNLDRQLEAAARRLAARGQAGARRGPP